MYLTNHNEQGYGASDDREGSHLRGGKGRGVLRGREGECKVGAGQTGVEGWVKGATLTPLPQTVKAS